MPIKILPFIEKFQNKDDEKEKKFVSQIEKPKPKRNNNERKIFFIKT